MVLICMCVDRWFTGGGVEMMNCFCVPVVQTPLFTNPTVGYLHALFQQTGQFA